MFADGTIRVVSYNIRMGKGQQEMATPRLEVSLPFGIRVRLPPATIPLARRGQLGRIAERLEVLDADVICLQEVNDRSLQSLGRDQAAEIAERLGMEHVFTVAHGEGRGLLKRQGNAVFTPHPILDHKTVELNPAAGEHERRIAVFARIALPGHPHGVWVASLHLASSSEEIRLSSIPRLLEALQDLEGPVILAGDFNAVPGSRTMEELHRRAAAVDRSLTDSFAHTGEGPGETGGAPEGRHRIDYVLSTPELTPVRAHSPRDLDESDHFAVVAELACRASEVGSKPADDAPRLSLLGVSIDHITRHEVPQ